jgi:predicted RNA-binding protein with PUA-like domain
MSFCDKVRNTPDISTCCQTGLRAIKSGDREKFLCSNTRLIEGCVDIDSCVREQYSQDNRWDYAVGYDGKVYFVEIHPADTSQVSVMINKLN